ncbi:MAG: AI-2E family transporter [Ignavibacteriales bacterium]|nr:AI-2E family transporter [Ignavibacteriota bacterium]MCB9248536.1 AI-2E family transporter [Ignavibacteriales bacterium]
MKKQFVDPAIKFFTIIIGLIVLFGVLKELQHIFVPLIIAYLLIFVFEPLNNYMMSKKIPQAVTTFIDLIIIIGFFWALSTFIIDSFSRLGEELPLYEQKLNNIVRSTAFTFGVNDPFLTEFDIAKLLTELDYGGIASNLFSSTLSIFSAGFFVLFFFIFVNSSHKHIINAIKKRYLKAQTESSLKRVKKSLIAENEEIEKAKYEQRLEVIKIEREKTIQKTFKDITEQIQRYIATKFLLSLLTGIIVGIILWIFDVDFLIVWAVLTFFLNFIPNIGSIIAVILPTIMALIQYESIGYTVLIAGTLGFSQNIIGNILEPKILGDRLGLNPLAILLSLLIWGYVWGIAGMFLSVPLIVVLKIIISNSKSSNLQFLNDLMESSNTKGKA